MELSPPKGRPAGTADAGGDGLTTALSRAQGWLSPEVPLAPGRAQDLPPCTAQGFI